MNKTAALKVARQSRQHGHYQIDYRTVYVFCPLCREKVVADLEYQETITSGIDRAMVAHAIEEHR